MAYFILICSGVSGTSTTEPAEIAKHRLTRALWPMSSRTANKSKIRDGDHLLIYLAGSKTGLRVFIASAAAASRVRTCSVAEPSSWLFVPAREALELRDIQYFPNPIPITPLLGRLEFITNVGHWGIHMKGGCKAITQADYRLILSSVAGLEGQEVPPGRG